MRAPALAAAVAVAAAATVAALPAPMLLAFKNTTYAPSNTTTVRVGWVVTSPVEEGERGTGRVCGRGGKFLNQSARASRASAAFSACAGRDRGYKAHTGTMCSRIKRGRGGYKPRGERSAGTAA